jgi:hypothetical protein
MADAPPLYLASYDPFSADILCRGIPSWQDGLGERFPRQFEPRVLEFADAEEDVTVCYQSFPLLLDGMGLPALGSFSAPRLNGQLTVNRTDA